jgi:diguanylate cyclase (GGDEF)-like protein
MELRAYIRLLLRGWWLILSSLLITVTATLVLTFSQVPVYRTTTTYLVSPSASFKELNSLLQGLDILSRREGINETFSSVATSRTIIEAAAAELELTRVDLKRFQISSQVDSPANIILITVIGDDPVLVADLANLVGDKTVDYVQTLYETYNLKSLDEATVPEAPIAPNKRQNLMLAGIIGLGLGVALSFVVEYLRVPADTVADINIIDKATGTYNQTYFSQRLNQELNRAKRHNYPLTIALMNIERLDTYKGLYSAQLRNEALRKVAACLKQYLREEDLIAYFEGSRFAFLFPDTPSYVAKETLEQLQQRIEWTTFEIESLGLKLNLAGSSGAASYEHNGISQEELLDEARQALQQARTNGLGKVYLWKENNDLPTT